MDPLPYSPLIKIFEFHSIWFCQYYTMNPSKELRSTKSTCIRTNEHENWHVTRSLLYSFYFSIMNGESTLTKLYRNANSHIQNNDVSCNVLYVYVCACTRRKKSFYNSNYVWAKKEKIKGSCQFVESDWSNSNWISD